MPIICDEKIYSVVREEHMPHNDFFLRFLDFPGECQPSELSFTCYAGDTPCYRVSYGEQEIAKRFQYGREEAARYRRSSLGRILGREEVPSNAFIHEYFSFFSSSVVNRLWVNAKCGGKAVLKEIAVVPYESPNSYIFLLKGAYVVTDTYPSMNSHRWCRNSEFAFDVGAFDDTLTRPVIGGTPVFAACGGVVEEAFDGLDDTCGDTDLEGIEKAYGEHARIDGNHVLIRHEGRELSLYAHLEKGSVEVKAGEQVRAGQRIGRVGSSGSSFLPHLHFHVMLDGIDGPGVPVRFQGLKTLLGEQCLLDDTVNLVRS